jgi:hypothetical protein
MAATARITISAPLPLHFCLTPPFARKPEAHASLFQMDRPDKALTQWAYQICPALLCTEVIMWMNHRADKSSTIRFQCVINKILFSA